MKRLVIGVLGGMGTYATIHLFEQYAQIFSAEKEWERPRILIDNNCTMPSRVLAYLEGKDRDVLILQMQESLNALVKSGANQIILACNTSHLFLPDIYKEQPGIEKYVVNIIKCCVEEILNSGIREVGLLGTEGTIQSGVYQSMLGEYGIICTSPNVEEYADIRRCIEAVKQCKYDREVLELFITLVNRFSHCILGCTELPILYDKCKAIGMDSIVYDPVYLALKKIKKGF